MEPVQLVELLLMHRKRELSQPQLVRNASPGRRARVKDIAGLTDDHLVRVARGNENHIFIGLLTLFE